MSATSSRAFLLSATLHGAVIAVLLFFTYVVSKQVTPTPKVFELVAGEGDNYMAREAPAFGTPGGMKVNIPKPPEPKPATPEPVRQEAAPVTPTPPAPAPKVATPPTPKAAEPVSEFKKKVVRDVIKAESKAKREIKKEREQEAKRVAEEQKRMSKEEFDRANKAKTAPQVAKNTPPKAPKVDYEGIAKGVVGGSTANKVAGAGGKALTAEEGDEADRYGAALLQRLKEALDRTPGLDDGLRAEAEFQITDDGRLIRAKITKSSRNADFDKAVLDAIAFIRMGPRPKGIAAVQVIPFTTHGKEAR